MRRHVADARIALLRGLDDMTIEIFLVPTVERLAAEVGSDGHAAAKHFAFLHGDVDFTAAGVSYDRIDFHPEGVFEHFGDQVIGAGGAAGAALGRLGSFRMSWRVLNGASARA